MSVLYKTNIENKTIMLELFLAKYEYVMYLYEYEYATLSMGFHEIELYDIIRNKFTLPVSNYFEQNWKSF